jgi:signal transduction histidine kinase
MKLLLPKYRNNTPVLYMKKNGRPLGIFVLGLLITIVIAYEIKVNDTENIRQNFESFCNDVIIKVESRLKAHAQLIRSGAAYIMASDSVTHEEWRKFNEREKINKNLPGIQCVGYSLIIPPKELCGHIQRLQKDGYPSYTVFPESSRETYTSVVYIEPFAGSNLKAFGFDMFTEPIRRKAMEISRDSDIAMLSGKVILVQETKDEMPAGTVMYAPVYQFGMPVRTIEERRAAIKGWVFSSYRMNDLMDKILGNWDLPSKYRIHLKIFDRTISYNSVLFDNHRDEISGKTNKPDLNLFLPVFFNGQKWIVQFTSESADLYFLKWKLAFVLCSGFLISFLLFALLVALFNSKFRERQIQILNIQLEKHNSDKDRFISILAHDLKSPFSALLGFVELLHSNIRNYPMEKIEAFVNNISSSVKNTYHLLEDILMWARIQSGKMPFDPQKNDLASICMEVIEGLELNAAVKDIAIKNSIKTPIEVCADRDMLNTIFRNLLSNAIKFTNKGGQIAISADQTDSEIIVTVSDNGIGIPSEIVNHLFNQLNMYTTTGTDNEKGTGFGLMLCKEFIEKNGGKIWVKSEVDKGSSFTFSLKKFHQH